MRIRPASALLVAVLVACAAPAGAGEAQARSPQEAIASGLAWLRGQQQADGGMGGRFRVGVTGLAALAHLAAGTTPDLPEHGPAVRRMLVFLANAANEKGYLGGDESRMYGHGIALLAVANALGTTRDDDLEERLRLVLGRGLAITIEAARVGKPESQRGGWRYQPDEASADLSVSGWQLAALHAARRAGMEVPDEVMRNALAYVRGMVTEDGKVGYAARGEDRPTMRGLAIFALDLQGGVRDPLRDRILARAQAEPITWAGPWLFYRAYYDAVGFGRCEPAAWPAMRERLHAALLPNQSKDGSWPAPPGDNEREYGAAYATALAVLGLSVDLRLLPAF